MSPLQSSNVSELLDAAPDAMVIADVEGTIVFVNAQTEALFGYDRAWLIGQQVEILLPERLRGVHPAHRKAFGARPAFRAMGDTQELLGRRSDGSEFPVDVSLSPVQTPAGLLISSAIRDVTERIATERALKEARDEARRSNRAKSAFLAAASHDLRQPLQALRLLNAVLARTATEPAAVQAIERQNASLDAMTDLLNALLDISRLESGAIKPSLSSFSLQPLMIRLRAQFEVQAQEKGLSLSMDHSSDVVRSDQGLLEHILQNLIANAIRYTPQGQVKVQCCASADGVRIAVSDTGIGIAEDEFETIFEEFYQVRSARDGHREGLGLGLSIVKRLTDLMALPLHVESTLGKGTCFSVTVPRGERHSSERERARTTAEPAAVQANVLIIDDDPAVADAVRMLLEIEGHKVWRAVTAADACRQVAASGAPDLILSDYHLGDGQTGVAAIAQMRADTGKLTPAVLVTGDTSPQVRLHASQLEQCEVLNKPVDTDELLRLIQRCTASP